MHDPIGFIGLGAMGLPMLANLSRDQQLTIYAHDLSEIPLRKLESEAAFGRTLFGNRTLEPFRQCVIVITMLPNSRATNAAILGADGSKGLAHFLPRGSTIIDMGSSDPIETMRLISILAESGIRLIDAPVSGAVAKARTGELSIMVGGDAAVVEELRPILARMGSRLIPTGKPASAHAMKALNNYVNAAGLLAVAEATAIAEAMELNTAIFADVLNASSGRNVASETKLKPFILPRTYSGGFALSLQAKDLAIAHNLQQKYAVETPQLELCAALWAEALQVLPENADNTAIHRFIHNRVHPATKAN